MWTTTITDEDRAAMLDLLERVGERVRARGGHILGTLSDENR